VNLCDKEEKWTAPLNLITRVTESWQDKYLNIEGERGLLTSATVILASGVAASAGVEHLELGLVLSSNRSDIVTERRFLLEVLLSMVM